MKRYAFFSTLMGMALFGSASMGYNWSSKSWDGVTYFYSAEENYRLPSSQRQPFGLKTPVTEIYPMENVIQQFRILKKQGSCRL